MTDIPIGNSSKAPRKSGWWDSLWGDADQRLDALHASIAQHPNAPAPYVLRGELYLERGAYALAEADFQRALALAEAQLSASDWGLVAQALQDRAYRGLAQARALGGDPPA